MDLDAELRDAEEERVAEREQEKKRKQQMRDADEYVARKSTQRGTASDKSDRSEDTPSETPSK